MNTFMNTLNKWIVWRLFPLYFWASIPVCAIRLLSPGVLPHYATLIIVLPLLGLAFALRQSNKIAVLYALTVAAFPLLACLWVISRLYHPARWMMTMYAVLVGPLAASLYVATLIILDIVLAYTTDTDSIPFLVWLAVICNFIILVSALKVLV